MDMSQYRDLFLSESRRHLEEINGLVVRLEQSNDPGIIHELFRHAHSLKGMAATMGFGQISGLAHKLEDLLGKIRDSNHPPTGKLIDILLEGSDLLDSLVTVIERNDGSPFPDTGGLITRIIAFDDDAPPPPPSGPREEVPPPSPPHQFRQSDSFKSVRVRTETLDRMLDITGELITSHHRLTEQASAFSHSIKEPLSRLSSQLRELRDQVFLARMMPFAVIAERFPRLVRDLARNEDKEAVLRIIGGDIELDRGILEHIAEPLVHILRNAVDHGLELPERRQQSQKERCGVITLTLTRDKDHVLVTVEDDGRGMDPSLLIAKAVERGLLTPEQAAVLSPEEAYMLICAPGFSTAETVSDVSGRGVGMDAVRGAIRSLGGVLSINSGLNRGTSISLKLPLTVSIIQALLVECGGLVMALPVSAIGKTLELAPNEICHEDGRQHCLHGNRKLPLMDLGRKLGLSPPAVRDHIPVVTCDLGGKKTGIIVDRIDGQREIFVKPLGEPLASLGKVAGSAILGDGRIVFVMDLNALAAPAAA